MVTEQDLTIGRSLLILIGSFIIFSAVGVMHPQDHGKYRRYRVAENYEMPRGEHQFKF